MPHQADLAGSLLEGDTYQVVLILPIDHRVTLEDMIMGLETLYVDVTVVTDFQKKFYTLRQRDDESMQQNTIELQGL